jgi:hypothetical protein
MRYLAIRVGVLPTLGESHDMFEMPVQRISREGTDVTDACVSLPHDCSLDLFNSYMSN